MVVEDGVEDLVLNALRHHGKDQERRHRIARIPARVLNALRHHGKDQLRPGRSVFQSDKCSTPYGITARISQDRARE